jgi:hypothetical protein
VFVNVPGTPQPACPEIAQTSPDGAVLALLQPIKLVRDDDQYEHMDGAPRDPFATPGFPDEGLAALHPGSRRMSLQIGLILPLS